MQIDLSSDCINLILELLAVENKRLNELGRTFELEDRWQLLIQARKTLIEKTLGEISKQVDS